MPSHCLLVLQCALFGLPFSVYPKRAGAFKGAASVPRSPASGIVVVVVVVLVVGWVGVWEAQEFDDDDEDDDEHEWGLESKPQDGEPDSTRKVVLTTGPA